MGNRHIRGIHLDYAIQNEKTIEQFSGGFLHNGVPATRYLTIGKQADEFWLHNHAVFDQRTEECLNLYAFDYLDIPEYRFEPIPVKFNSMEDALMHAAIEFGASADRWVNKEFRGLNTKTLFETAVAHQLLAPVNSRGKTRVHATA